MTLRESRNRTIARLRIHGTTRKLPLVVFRDEEQNHLLPYDGMPYAVPLWGQVTVHPDHHIAFRYAIYSVPYNTCPPGARLEVRLDRDLIRIFRRGEKPVEVAPGSDLHELLESTAISVGALA